MVVVGFIVVFMGVVWTAMGALPRSGNDQQADRALLRGMLLLPGGLALMVAGSPSSAYGIPRWVLALFVVASSVVTAYLVYKMAEEEDREADLLRPVDQRIEALARAQSRLDPSSTRPQERTGSAARAHGRTAPHAVRSRTKEDVSV